MKLRINPQNVLSGLGLIQTNPGSHHEVYAYGYIRFSIDLIGIVSNQLITGTAD